MAALPRKTGSLHLDPILVAISIGAAALGATLYRRWAARRTRGVETARNVEAERIIALLSSKQPGVWDQDELRERILSTARDLWSAPTRADLDRLQTWVHPGLLDHAQKSWSPRAVRREVTVQFRTPVAFVQVNEGGPGPDRLIARIESQSAGQFFDARGSRVKGDRRPLASTYHTWVHIDGQGWRLEAIAELAPIDEPPPSSVTCCILPQGASEETERRG